MFFPSNSGREASSDAALSAAPEEMPVSYTHLDVYKRQLMACAGAIARRAWAAGAPIARAGTVSYTHLDVYKRQPQLVGAADRLAQRFVVDLAGHDGLALHHIGQRKLDHVTVFGHERDHVDAFVGRGLLDDGGQGHACEDVYKRQQLNSAV